MFYMNDQNKLINYLSELNFTFLDGQWCRKEENSISVIYDGILIDVDPPNHVVYTYVINYGGPNEKILIRDIPEKVYGYLKNENREKILKKI